MANRKPNTHQMDVSIYDMDWISHPEYCGGQHPQVEDDLKPANFELMKSLAIELSKPFYFVRVDFYEVNEMPVFGEMTFTPGFDTVNMRFEKYIGERIDINVELLLMR